MNKEDYFKYYIQGSDHYLIPKDIFDELFNEMSNWKEESKELKQKYLNAVADYEITMSELQELKRKLNEAIHKATEFESEVYELQQENQELKDRISKTIEYIEKDTRWFDSEYASIYGTLCTCAGAKDNRLEVMVNPSNLLKILKGDEISDN